MCGRYLLNGTPDEVGRYFGVPVTDNFPPRYNIAPTQPVAIIRQDPLQRPPARQYALVRWGLIPSWSKEGDMYGRPLINARSETVAEKASFRSAFARRRCLFICNGFYEWKTERGEKQPYRLSLESEVDMPLFAMAGVWEDWLGADGSELETAAILTRDAIGEMRAIHNREPVLVAREDFDDWLHTDELDHALFTKVMNKPRHPKFRLTRVSKAVSNVRNEGPDLLKPDEGADLFGL